MAIARWLDLPPLWTLAHAALAWLAGMWWAPLPGLRGVGWALLALSAALFLWAGATMARAGTTVIPGRGPARLVTRGPFRLSRNPIYLADLGVVAAVAFLAGQPLGLVLVVPLWQVLTHRFVRKEEATLASAFGPAFAQYRARVPRWLGRTAR